MKFGVAALLWCAPVFAADVARVEAVLTQEMKDSHIPGVAFAIVMGTDVVYRKGFGYASQETQQPIAPEMLFRLGSTTKMFTAATLASLAEEGKIDLNAPVSRYVSDIAPCIGKVTAHQLLTHTAGIKDIAPMFGSHDETALAANVRSWREDFCKAEPGGKWSYSNPSYVLAGYLAEVVSGKPYADIVEEKILKPLHMTRSTFRPTMAMTWPLAEGHNRDMEIIRPAADYAGAWPAGSLFSNVDDLAQWTVAFLNGGFSAKVIEKMSTPYVDKADGKAKYGYGLDVRMAGSVKILEHAGNRDGYGTFIRMYPQRRVALIILGNRTGAVFPKTLAAAAASFDLP